ncbi:heavy-metal-associated domain-containing protein [Terrisporobacter sp.]|uniref:heavy-metal-associated domain-containing protein n=1 Tax=Terrisporobacter sp. TaxID=1965305 RepID=UPI002607D876|nr:heavy metal-associated domain-containing protein [Terrisporobacter sp.]
MKKKLSIEGMKCSHCVANLQDALTEDIKGVKVLEVNLEGKYAVIDMDEEASMDEVKAIIEDLGFNLVSVI